MHRMLLPSEVALVHRLRQRPDLSLEGVWLELYRAVADGAGSLAGSAMVRCVGTICHAIAAQAEDQHPGDFCEHCGVHVAEPHERGCPEIPPDAEGSEVWVDMEDDVNDGMAA